MLLVARDEEGYNKFRKPMLDLSAGEGLETAPSRTAITLKDHSMEMGSRILSWACPRPCRAST